MGAMINYNAYADPNIWAAVNAYIDAYKQNPRVYPEDFGLGAKLEGTPGFEGSQGSAARANAPVALAQANADGTLQKDEMGNILNANEVISDAAAGSAGVLPANHPDFELPKVEDVVQQRLPGAANDYSPDQGPSPTYTSPPSTQSASDPEVQSAPETILRDDGTVDPNGVRRDLTAEDYGFEGGYTPPTQAELDSRSGNNDPQVSDINIPTSVSTEADLSTSTSGVADSYQSALADGLYLKDNQQADYEKQIGRLTGNDPIYDNPLTRERILDYAGKWAARSGDLEAAKEYFGEREASMANRGKEPSYDAGAYGSFDDMDSYIEHQMRQQRSFIRLPKVDKDAFEQAIKDVAKLPDAQKNPDMEQVDPYDTAQITTIAVKRQIDTKHSLDFSSNINEIITFRRDRPPTSLFPNARSGLCRVRKADGSTEYVPD